jgi:hypothetical protein
MKIIPRKFGCQVIETVRENGQELPAIHKVAIVAVVFENPYSSAYQQDLLEGLNEAADEIGRLVGPPTVELLGEPVEAYGKAALVGLDGEVEHDSAFIHNLKFGNRFRDACGGTELLPAAEKVGNVGASVDIPIKHLTKASTRSHHQTITFQIPDAPRPDEILVACVCANAGRPLARLASFGTEVSTS